MDRAGMRRMGSVKSRKVSTQSLQSTTSADETAAAAVTLAAFVNIDDSTAASTVASATAAGPDILTEEVQDIQTTDLRDTTADELDYCHNMPWIKVRRF